MKIIFINRFFYPDHSATSQILSDLAFNLASEGYVIHVISGRQIYDNARAKLKSQENIRGVSIHRVWSSSYGRQNLFGRFLDYLTFYISLSWKLLFLVSSNDIIVPETDPPLLSVPTTFIAKLRHCRIVNWLQDLFPEVAVKLGISGSSIVGPFLKSIRNVSMKLADANVCIGDRMAEALADEGVSRKQIKVIHNWADGNVIKPITTLIHEIRSQWGLEDKFIVGYSGNMGRSHEFETILRAAAELNRRKDVVFLFIGGGPKKVRIEEYAAQNSLRNVIFKPYQSYGKLAGSLGAIDVHLISLIPELEGFIVPSKFYGICAAGRPSLFIGDKDGEIARLIRRYDCGYCLSIGDAKGLIEKIGLLMREKDLRAAMGCNARKCFDKDFSMERAMIQWRQIFEARASHE